MGDDGDISYDGDTYPDRRTLLGFDSIIPPRNRSRRHAIIRTQIPVGLNIHSGDIELG